MYDCRVLENPSLNLSNEVVLVIALTLCHVYLLNVYTHCQDKACQRFGAGIKNVYGRNRSSWSAVRVDAGKHVGFCRGFVLSTAEKVKLFILRPTRHTGELLFYRAMSVSDGKPRSVSRILVFFGLDPAPPSFQHARPPKRC